MLSMSLVRRRMVCGFFGLVAMAGLGCTESGNGLAGFSAPTLLAPATTNVAKDLLVVAQQSPIVDPNAGIIDGFGDAIALDGNTAIVGAPMANKAYVFKYNGEQWLLQSTLVPGGGAASGRFGASVAIDGDTAIVGAPNHSENAMEGGAAYLFQRSGAVWSPAQKLLVVMPNVLMDNDHFGNAVALDGDTALVGAIGDDVGANMDQGSAYVFKNSGGVWTDQKMLVAMDGVMTDGAAMDAFGASISLSGNTALIGAPLHGSGGAAYVFVGAGAMWNVQKKLVASNGAALDEFGGSVSLSGDTALVGAALHDSVLNEMDDQGAAYFFMRSGTLWTEQLPPVVASNWNPGDHFGASVSVSGDIAIVESSNSGVAMIGEKGSAYFFVRNGNAWTEDTPLIAGNGLDFRVPVAISGNTALIAQGNSSQEAVNVYVFRKGLGDACTNGTECASSFCVDSVCCNSACSGTCNACTVNAGAAIDGTCGLVSGRPCDDSLACTDMDTCQAGVCMGIPIACSVNQCNNAYCDPQDGLCKTQPKIDGTTCNDDKACTRMDACQNGECVGNPMECPNVDDCHVGSCNELTGTCGTILDASNPMCIEMNLELGMKCLTKTQCESGQCADGVCCNVACDVGCHSCVVPNWVGTCVLEQFGEDRRGDCGEPLACSRTCSGIESREMPDEMCRDANGKTKCVIGGCFDKMHSQLPVSCTIEDKGNSCKMPMIQDCGEYLCNDIDGACRTHCETADDCAPGLACDPQGRCGKPPREVTSCSFTNRGHASGSSGVFLGGVLVLFSWLRRRTRTVRHPFALFMLALLGIAGCGAEPIPQVNLELSTRSTALTPTIDSLVWTPQQQLVDVVGIADDKFGYSVAVDGDTAIVGVPYADVGTNADQGAAFVFVRDAMGVWTEQKKLVAETGDGAASDSFGTSVSLSGDMAIVGAPLGDGNVIDSGSAYVFVRVAGVWSAPVKLVAVDGNKNDQFGTSVSLSGNTAIVGAPGAAINGISQGAAYIFANDGMTWTQNKLMVNPGATGDNFGISVAVSTKTAIVGANGRNLAQGAAYVFVENGGTWMQEKELVAVLGLQGDSFGTSVALSGDTALVGAPSRDVNNVSNVGSAYAFSRSGSVWPLQKEIINVGGQGFDFFGSSVSVSAGTVLVGASNGRIGTRFCGWARVFKWDGMDYTAQTTFTPDGIENKPLFGKSVSLSGNTALVGAPSYDVNVMGVDQGVANVFALLNQGGDPCVSGGECASTVCLNGVCQKSNGETCAVGIDCASGFCTDDVCCDSLCGGGVCDACSTATGALTNGMCRGFNEIPCDDGDKCTDSSICALGVCVAVNPPLQCTALDDCHASGTCDPTTGMCSNPTLPTNTPCNDKNACTQTDTCQAGVCIGSNPVTCTSDDCHNAYCDPNDNGICKELPKPDNSVCNDGDGCTLVDACQSGICKGTNPKACPNLDACHVGKCVTDTGQCVSAFNTTNDACSKLELGVKCVEAVPGDGGGCNSGYCVDGVCCDLKCEGTCYSCVLPGKVGQCQVENENQDRRGLCSPGGPCVRTCSGKMPDPLDPNADPCIDATTDTQCTVAQCVDPTHSLDAAFCTATTPMGPMGPIVLACNSATPNLKDCGNLACEEPSGACRAECINASDCGPGYACNPDRQCIPPPPHSSGETPSCVFAPHSSTNGFPTGFASIVAFVGIAFIRRRLRFTRVDR